MAQLVYRIECKLLAAGTSVAPPEHSARSVGSVLPPAPTVSSNHTCVDCEPELTSAKITTTSDNDAASHDSSSQADSGESDNDSDSGSDHDTGGHSAKITSATVRIGPSPRSKRIQPSEPITATADASDTGGHSAKIMSATVCIGPPSRSKRIQPSEPITATADTSDHGNLDVKMHSPPHGQSSQ